MHTHRIQIAALVACFVLLAPFASQAHLAAGTDKTIGEYVVDFGFDPEYPRVGEEVLMAFALHGAATEQEVDFTHVWVRISDEEQILSSVNVAQDDSGTTYVYTFPHVGTYTLQLEFKNGEDSLVKTDMLLTVAEVANAQDDTGGASDVGDDADDAAEDSDRAQLPLVIVGSLLVGGLLGVCVSTAMRRKQLQK